MAKGNEKNCEDEKDRQTNIQINRNIDRQSRQIYRVKVIEIKTDRDRGRKK